MHILVIRFTVIYKDEKNILTLQKTTDKDEKITPYKEFMHKL